MKPQEILDLEKIIGYELHGSSMEFRYISCAYSIEDGNVISLCLRYCGISNIDFLENFPHLRYLTLSDNDVTDISPLKYVPNLLELELEANANIENFDAIGKLESLEFLNLHKCDVSDLSFLRNHQKLKHLYIASKDSPFRENKINTRTLTMPSLVSLRLTYP